MLIQGIPLNDDDIDDILVHNDDACDLVISRYSNADNSIAALTVECETCGEVAISIEPEGDTA